MKKLIFLNIRQNAYRHRRKYPHLTLLLIVTSSEPKLSGLSPINFICFGNNKNNYELRDIEVVPRNYNFLNHERLVCKTCHIEEKIS